jgi:hypothetical protein
MEQALGGGGGGGACVVVQTELHVWRSITGSSVPYAGGGGGGLFTAGTAGTGGTGGGGNGGANAQGSNGTANLGGGGGGSASASGTNYSGANGGSGVVIIKTPDTVTATFTGATFGNNSPDFDNSLPITSVSGFNIYVVSQATAATVTFF